MQGMVFVIVGILMTLISIFDERVRPFIFLGIIFVLYGLFKIYLSIQVKKQVKKTFKKKKKSKRNL